MSPSAHFVQFYERDEYLLDSLHGFAAEGLSRGESVIVFATPAHRAGLAARLLADGFELGALEASGQYVPFDAADMMSLFMPDDQPQPDRIIEALTDVITRAEDRGRRIRIFGEIVALLWARGDHSAAITLEGVWNRLGESHDFSLFCAYPISGFAGEALADSHAGVCGQHSRILPAESYSALNTTDERLRAIASLQQRALSLEGEVEDRKRQAVALQRALRNSDELMSEISHDLKTPLTVLLGQAQLLQRRVSVGNLDADGLRAGLQQIEARSRAMAALIDELLEARRGL
jgi:signal transduction histidine kinase